MLRIGVTCASMKICTVIGLREKSPSLQNINPKLNFSLAWVGQIQ